MSGPGFSQHPTDVLIRELIRGERRATDEEIARIVERMATAPFGRGTVHVRLEEREATYRGQMLGARADSLTYHLTKRVVIERQWVPGTTAGQYVADLRRAVRAPSVRLAVYNRHAGHLAAALTPTDLVLPAQRRGARALPELLVIYSADRGIIVTGYQITGLETASIPEEARWLA